MFKKKPKESQTVVKHIKNYVNDLPVQNYVTITSPRGWELEIPIEGLFRVANELREIAMKESGCCWDK